MERTRRRVLLTAIAASVLAGDLVSGRQSAQPPTSIAGRVVDGATGAAIDGATVIVTATGKSTTESSSSGQFRVVLPAAADRLRIEASKPGYLIGYRGQLGPDDNLAAALRLDISPGEQIRDLVIRLWPEGAIRGVIADAQGAPIAGAVVDALARTYTGAGPRWEREGQTARTDAAGVYRIARLAPGSYIVAARPPVTRNTDVRLSPPAYYPGVRTAASASAIAVDGSETRADVTLETVVSAGPLTGRLVATGASLDGAWVRLIPIDGNGAATEFDEVLTMSTADGRFQFRGVPDGRYRVIVCHFPKSDAALYVLSGDSRRLVTSSHSPPGQDPINPLPDAPTWTANADIVVDDPRSRDIVVTLQPGARISGRVVFHGRGTPPSGDTLLKVPMAVRPADGGNFGFLPQPGTGIPQSRIEADGTFRTTGLPPGWYVLGVLPNSSAAPWNTWRMSSILVHGRETLGRSVTLDSLDITDVVVTMTDQPSEIQGVVRDGKGVATQDARVIAFPADPSDRQHYWAMAPRRILPILPDSRGTFRAPLIPGDYLVAAVQSFPRDWMSPEFLQTIAASATAVRITAGAIANVTVTARPAGR